MSSNLIRTVAVWMLLFPALPAQAESDTARLARLTRGWQRHDGIVFTYDVHDGGVNAYSTPGRSIRVSRGLMRLMRDEEVSCVIAHEIGHIVLGHFQEDDRRKSHKAAMAEIHDDEGEVTEEEAAFNRVMDEAEHATHAQGQEREADEFALDFMKRHGRNPAACISVMEKLARISGKSRWRDDHPDALGRAERVREQLEYMDFMEWFSGK
jgi:putative metalloprotease